MGSYQYRASWLCFSRKFKVEEPEPPEDIKEAFRKYTAGKDTMTAEQLRLFLEEVQREDGASVEMAELIIKRVHEDLQKRQHVEIDQVATAETLSLHDFHHYLFSADLNPPIESKVKEDTMKAPLSHYFIFTGHNSYLKGNQLTSKSCVEPIIESLKRGVRAVELDLWPKGKNIKVVHGRTMTKPVPLIECLRAINEHAFSASEYPVILTLEDHLTRDLQEKVAKMLEETFGNKLYITESELEECPSPEDLKGRILVSTKPPKEYFEQIQCVEEECEEDDDDYDDDDNDNDDSLAADDDDKHGKEPLTPTSGSMRRNGKRIKRNYRAKRATIKRRIQSVILSFLRIKHRLTSLQYKIDSETSETDERLAYRKLISIQAGKPEGVLKAACSGELNKVRRISLNEQAFEKAIESHGSLDIGRFTQNHFLRVYPKATRFNSSNYNPFVGWMHGAQMVAFNMQGHGRHLWAMRGMFRGNGGCGYVKKPDILLKEMSPTGQVFDPKARLPVKNTLKIKVYTTDGWDSDFKLTHFDRLSPPDFYVRVGIAGVPADKRMRRTREKMDEWSPAWNEEFSFPLTVPELALLRVEVHEYDRIEDDFCGQTCLPVLELKSGIRAVPLHCRKGKKYKHARLLMRFSLE